MHKVLSTPMIPRILKCLLPLGLLLLTACDYEWLLFDPKGPVGEQEKQLIINSFLIMLIVVVPVIIMTVVFAYRYRSSNQDNVEYEPEWSHSNKIEFWVWTIPCLIILALAVITYQTSHSLDPRKVLDTKTPALQIQVVAQDWKWLFIYPEQEIATVNEIAIPVNRTVEFLVTSDTVMNSFFIPQLGSQIYAMAGMENRLHLMADEPGTFIGYSANYSGFGFSGMKFKTLGVSDQEFDAWVAKVKDQGEVLSSERYQALVENSRDHPVEYFKLDNPLLFNNIIEKYTGIQNDK